MKKYTFLLFFVSFTLNSQISKLADLASGKIELFSPIYNLDSDIYGYFAVFKLDTYKSKGELFEYVLLDKNLNKVANGEFIDLGYKSYYTEFLPPEKIGEKIILSKLYFKSPYETFGDAAAFKFISNRILNITTNKISEPFYFNDDEIVDGERSITKIDKTVKQKIFIEYPIALEDGFLVFKESKLNKNSLNNKKIVSIRAFNIDNSQKWEYVYNPNEDILSTSISHIDKDKIVLWTRDFRTKIQLLHFIDSKTGKLIFKYELENKTSDYNHLFKVRVFDDKTIIVGMMSKNTANGFDFAKPLGLFKIELDENGNESMKKYFNWQNATDFLEIKKNGKFEDGYSLLAKQFFIFNDGSTAFLTEKFKDQKNFIVVTVAPKTTDFLILNFNIEFEFNNFEEIKKDQSFYTNSDYLYSQRIKDGNGVVFFYRDYKKDEETKKKNWILGIVTIIDGKMKHEQIPMSSDDFYISPYIAKEGYILLREFNKDRKYDNIRLEKLNY